MKIIIVGVARSRSELLTEILASQHPDHECLYEHYTHRQKKSNYDARKITCDLSDKNNFIMKILGHNLIDDPASFGLMMYDQIHLIERYDFFDQCCSLHVSATTKTWHMRKHNQEFFKSRYKMINASLFRLKKEDILFVADSISRYLSVKKYLIDNKLSFTLHTYDDLASSMATVDVIDPMLDYKKLFINYHLKDEINRLFHKHFDYSIMRNDFVDFAHDIESLNLG